VVAVAVTPDSVRAAVCVAVTLLALAILGYLGARLGGGRSLTASARVVIWGALAMAVTSGIGAIVGATV
jgi:VIT1/CCC1 family predicted Fe2+/Mn2+ transporter